MSLTIEGLRGERTGLNPLVALSAISSYLPTDRLYTADSGRWTQSMLWLRDRYEESHPEILANLSFSYSGRYSREVSEFLTLAQFGTIFETRTVFNTKYRIREEAMAEIRTDLRKGLDQTQKDVIEGMADDLVEYKGDLLFSPD